MATELEYQTVLREVSNWPAERRASLAHALIESLQPMESVATRPKPTLDQILGVARGAGPPPTDEQVKEWIDEYRMGKYGR